MGRPGGGGGVNFDGLCSGEVITGKEGCLRLRFGGGGGVF